MSWNFRKAGKDVAALKAAVQAEMAPQQLKDEVCKRIDGQTRYLDKGCCISVHTYGHLETTADGALTLQNAAVFIEVYPVPYIDTPV